MLWLSFLILFNVSNILFYCNTKYCSILSLIQKITLYNKERKKMLDIQTTTKEGEKYNQSTNLKRKNLQIGLYFENKTEKKKRMDRVKHPNPERESKFYNLVNLKTRFKYLFFLNKKANKSWYVLEESGCLHVDLNDKILDIPENMFHVFFMYCSSYVCYFKQIKKKKKKNGDCQLNK
ncbi:hypothetical protein RFI_11766 [Reticulomyxa filosa]|uniref:Uncharacterized protein n=1 Tax=Reticulomyxa filosa TaxID=46433 RepID=X6NHN2_RETFI|nr:hypothetical protein RFI_11766 [Reticulomyxa filosa]|eukprot:ETO25373.1 hypothetical protein RFI_11766 [Reticulomyxa filosa]